MNVGAYVDPAGKPGYHSPVIYMSQPKPLHEPGDGPMRVVGLFSGGGSGIRYLLNREGNQCRYRIVGAVSDSPGASGIEILKEQDLQVRVLDKDKFYSDDGRTEETRRRFFSELIEEINPFSPHLLVLSGFMQIVTEPLLTEFENRIINVHPADLRIEENGSRKFVGDDSVYDAVRAGEKEVRSTVHLVTAEVDAGPILVVSRPFPVERELVSTLQEHQPQLLRSYVDALQEWMKWKGDGPCLHRGLELYARGQVYRENSGILLKRQGELLKGYLDLGQDEIVRGD